MKHLKLSDFQRDNIHLLGKCNGAWIVTSLLLKSYNYKGLYLAVPGIPPGPSGTDLFYEIPVQRLNQINFVFGWRTDDAFPFHWGLKSYQEKIRYDYIMDSLAKKVHQFKYISYMDKITNEEDPKLFHEITPNIIDVILSSI